MATGILKISDGFSRAGRMGLTGLFLSAFLSAPSATPAHRTHHRGDSITVCTATVKPEEFAGKIIVDRLLISDVSPHDYLYQSRHCKMKLAAFWSNTLKSSDAWKILLNMFYKPSRLPTEVGPRVIEATITGRIIRHRFPEGDKPVWAIEIEHFSNFTVAPEGYCAVNPQDWFDLQKETCNQAKVTTEQIN